MIAQRNTGRARDSSGSALRRELDDDYWATLARTADLVRKLTSLADRYDAVSDGDGDVRAAERRASVALLRTAAESGRQLIRSLEAPPSAPAGQEASPTERDDRSRVRDLRASGRDAAAERRDERASHRDAALRQAGGDRDPDFAGRLFAASERDEAAGDRAAALADRRAAADDRARSATRVVVDLDKHARAYAMITRPEERELVRQAQGILMARAGITAGEAFEALLLAAMGPVAPEGVVELEIRETAPRSGGEQDAT